MASFDDDDEPSRYESARGGEAGGGDSWDRDSADEADLAPDDLATIRCARCRKYILEDSVRCPYCKHLQLEEESNRRGLWFTLTAILCIVLIGGYLLFGLFDIFAWFHR